MEEEQDEETADERKSKTTISETDASLFAEGDVILSFQGPFLKLKNWALNIP